MVLHDKTLKDIAAKKPQSLADLEDIHGIGIQKIKAYGDAILEVMASPA